jgi:tetratricopeptide (TPR) repeat protein
LLLYEQRGELESALADYTAFTSLASANPQGFYYRGALMLELGDAQAALIDLTLAICLQSPDRVECEGALIESPLTPGFFEEYRDALYARGRAFTALGQHVSAAHDMEEALQLGLETADLWSDLGLAYFQIGEANLAERSLLQAVELGPDSFGAHYSLAFFYKEIGQYHPAILAADAALRIDPSSVEAITLRGNAWLNAGNFEEALDDFELAYEMDTSYGPALLGIAEAQTALGQHDEALGNVNFYLQNTSPDDPNYEQAVALLETLKAQTGQ